MSTATLTNLRDYLYGTLSPANMMWLGTQLTERAMKEEHTPEPYTMEEINTILDVAEAEIAEGIGTPHEEMMREWKEELAREEQEELEFSEAV